MRRSQDRSARRAGLLGVLARVPTMAAALPLAGRRAEAPAGEGQFWTFMAVSAVLVLLGGMFAGLTLGLMGQDEMYLKVISTSGSRAERQHARKVLRLIGRGKHWVLVTLLLSNVITNETLPIVLDRCLGGGWQAVVMSTGLIVVFGEIIPQSVCVRYGLEVGAWCSPFVLCLMYLTYPVAYPIALLLDYLLGEDHGTVYKKSGLKTLVTLHKTMGVERLTQDEVTIISAVLDLKDKQVQEIMTPIENVFTISADRILDEKVVEEIFNSGFSRIPIYLPGQPTNFIGMLLVRVLISYDPADALPVSHFPLATLPETSPNTSCLNILNYFQEGKSHMCIVSRDPGSSSGALGVVTLEDVIEELIGEEIVDESDVFVNIHQRIVREQPGPLSRRHVTSYLHSLYTSTSRASAVAAAAGARFEQAGPAEKQSLLGPGQADGRLHPVQDVIQPLNPAANPLNISNPHVTIKRQAAMLQHAGCLNRATTHSSNENHVLQSAHGSPPQERAAHCDYGGTSTTPSRDQAAREVMVDEHSALATKALEHTYATGSTTHVVTTMEPGRSPSSSHLRAGLPPRVDAPAPRPGAAKEPPYRNAIASSYRSTKNGIVESIVTIEGVPKTIIEPAQDWDDSHSAAEFRLSSHRGLYLESTAKDSSENPSESSSNTP
ncbi:AaceriADR312Wp [[Ashbya] aceris (nom. inval.)]|nr:AaceriADR312Wp [[Ashbya] aceris (nom. inval.)]